MSWYVLCLQSAWPETLVAIVVVRRGQTSQQHRALEHEGRVWLLIPRHASPATIFVL